MPLLLNKKFLPKKYPFFKVNFCRVLNLFQKRWFISRTEFVGLFLLSSSHLLSQAELSKKAMN